MRRALRFTATTSRRSRPRHNTTLSPASRALERAAVSDSTPHMCPTHCRLSRMPSGDFFVAPRPRSPSMISATELVQIAAPARSTGLVTFGQPRPAKVFRAEPHETRYGCVKGRASGRFLGASRARPPLPPRHTRGIPEQLPLAGGDRRAAASSRTSAAISA